MPFGLTAEAMTAWATLGTALVAAGAAVFAYFQIREARTLREQQSRPYVVVDMIPLQAGQGGGLTLLVEMTVKNFGATLARNVRISFDPPLEGAGRAEGVAAMRFIKEGIPSMPPNKEVVATFEIRPHAKELAWPRTYSVTVSCDDFRGKAIEPSLEYVIDLGAYEGIRFL